MTKENKDSSKEQESKAHHYAEYVKEHAQHAAEYTKDLMSSAHTTHADLTKKVTDICATNLALGKSFLNCTHFDDIVGWGEKFVKTNLDHCVESASSIYSKACSEVTKANGEIAKKVSKNFVKMKNKSERSDD